MATLSALSIGVIVGGSVAAALIIVGFIIWKVWDNRRATGAQPRKRKGSRPQNQMRIPSLYAPGTGDAPLEERQGEGQRHTVGHGEAQKGQGQSRAAPLSSTPSNGNDAATVYDNNKHDAPHKTTTFTKYKKSTGQEQPLYYYIDKPTADHAHGGGAGKDSVGAYDKLRQASSESSGKTSSSKQVSSPTNAARDKDDPPPYSAISEGSNSNRQYATTMQVGGQGKDKSPIRGSATPSTGSRIYFELEKEEDIAKRQSSEHYKTCGASVTRL